MKRKKDFCISFLEMKAGRRKIAQSDFAENIEIDGLQIEYTDVMTGDKNRNRFLYYQLQYFFCINRMHIKFLPVFFFWNLRI